MFASERRHLPLLAAILMMLSGAASAQSSDRDQEQIKRLRLQIRQLQQQHDAALQEAQAGASRQQLSAEQAVKAARAEASGQQAALGAAQKRSTGLAAELKSSHDDNARLKEQLAQLQGQLDETRQAAQQAQSSHHQLQSAWQVRQEALAQQQAQCRAHNAELYGLGTDLLRRYENKGMAEVLATREPFVQTARVKLENLRAEYQDRLDAARVKAPSSTPVTAP